MTTKGTHFFTHLSNDAINEINETLTGAILFISNDKLPGRDSLGHRIRRDYYISVII